MKKTFTAILAAVAMSVPVNVVSAAPAQAHVSTCTVSAYNPSQVAGTRTLRGKGRWYCSTVSHHEYVSSKVEVQYWSERIFWGDGWATLSRNRQESTSITGTTYSIAGCANGARRYRTKYTLYMVGDHGVVEKKAYSYGTTINC